MNASIYIVCYNDFEYRVMQYTRSTSSLMCSQSKTGDIYFLYETCLFILQMLTATELSSAKKNYRSTVVVVAF